MFFLIICLFCTRLTFEPQHEFSNNVECAASKGSDPREGGTLIFSNIRRLGYLLGFKILNLNIFGVFRKMNIFWGYEVFVDIFWGSSQNWASLMVISMHFMVLFKVEVQNWDIVLGC